MSLPVKTSDQRQRLNDGRSDATTRPAMSVQDAYSMSKSTATRAPARRSPPDVSPTAPHTRQMHDPVPLNRRPEPTTEPSTIPVKQSHLPRVQEYSTSYSSSPSPIRRPSTTKTSRPSGPPLRTELSSSLTHRHHANTSSSSPSFLDSSPSSAGSAAQKFDIKRLLSKPATSSSSASPLSHTPDELIVPWAANASWSDTGEDDGAIGDNHQTTSGLLLKPEYTASSSSTSPSSPLSGLTMQDLDSAPRPTRHRTLPRNHGRETDHEKAPMARTALPDFVDPTPPQRKPHVPHNLSIPDTTRPQTSPQPSTVDTNIPLSAASQIALAYQQSQAYLDDQLDPNSWSASASRVSPLDIGSFSGKVVAMGYVDDWDSPSPRRRSVDKEKSTGGLRGITRKVSGKFTRRPKTMDGAPSMPLSTSYSTASSAATPFDAVGSQSSSRTRGDPDALLVSSRPSTTRTDSRASGRRLVDEPLMKEGARFRQTLDIPRSEAMGYVDSSGEKTPRRRPQSAKPGEVAGEASSGGLWKLMRKFSSGTMREKHRSQGVDGNIPPVPALPSTLPITPSRSTSSRRSSVASGYGVLLQHEQGPPALEPGYIARLMKPRPSLGSQPGASAPRPSLTSSRSVFSTSPPTSDMSSRFSARQSSRTSTSSYMDGPDADTSPPPPMPALDKYMQSQDSSTSQNYCTPIKKNSLRKKKSGRGRSASSPHTTPPSTTESSPAVPGSRSGTHGFDSPGKFSGSPHSAVPSSSGLQFFSRKGAKSSDSPRPRSSRAVSSGIIRDGTSSIPVPRPRSNSFGGGSGIGQPSSVPSTKFAFLEMPADQTRRARTGDEKDRMWADLLEKSHQAGGTLHATVDVHLPSDDLRLSDAFD